MTLLRSVKIIDRSRLSLLFLFLLVSLFSRAQSGTDSVKRNAFFKARLSGALEKLHFYALPLIDSFDNAGGALANNQRPRTGGVVDSAMHYSDLAMDLADSLADRITLGQLYAQRPKLEAIRGNYEQAHNFFIAGWNINDSLNSQQKKNRIAELKGKQDLESREKEIALKKLEASVQRKALSGLIAGIVLLAVIAVLLYRQKRIRQKTNTTLLVLNNRLEEANKLKARFFGILSHDLRSPISNLLSFVHLVKNDPETISAVEKAEYEREIGRSAEGLLETMEAMLLWSKEQMNSFKPDLREIAVGDLFLYLQKFFAQEQVIRIEFSPATGLYIRADENYLRVIMQNLTSNAIKALKNRPDAVIKWNAAGNGEETLLSVSDNGPGMSPEKSRALFTESADVNARSGFGFHLIRDLARAIRLGITVKSDIGLGTTFTLRSSSEAAANPSIVAA